MFIAAGPQGVLTGLWSKVVGNIPGYEASGEATFARQAAMDRYATALTSLQKGRKLATEQARLERLAPSSQGLINNPMNEIVKAIGVREWLNDEIRLNLETIANPHSSVEDRRAASREIRELRGVLVTMPSMVQLTELQGQVRSGQGPAQDTISVPSLEDAQRAIPGTNPNLKLQPQGRPTIEDLLKINDPNELVKQMSDPTFIQSLSPAETRRLRSHLNILMQRQRREK